MSDTQRTNDDLNTPRWIIRLVRELGSISLDPCANPWSFVCAHVEISAHRGEDGLARPWAEIVEPTSLVFVNPPYSAPMPWCRRIVEAADAGLEVVALLKLDPSTRWSEVIRDRRDARCDLHRRVSFEGGAHKTGAMASTIAYFGQRPHLFCHLFQGVGEVQVYGRRRS